MAFLGKNFTLYKQENYDEFLKFIGLPENQMEPFLKFVPSQKLTKNGDSYTYSNVEIEGLKEITFKSGVEFDDVVAAEKYPIKNKIVVDGNTVYQTVTTDDRGIIHFKKEYNGDELVATITADRWDGVAKRYYKA